MLIFIALANAGYAQLAGSYPNDIGIESDSNVLYVEKFDDGMENILNRYTDRHNAEGMFLDTDIPPGSLGSHSLKMTSKQGVNGGGHLYGRFTPGFEGTVYVRYYVNILSCQMVISITKAFGLNSTTTILKPLPAI